MTTHPMTFYTDRSRMQAYRNCPRLRYLAYHHEGTGIERVSRALPLVTGIAVHEALAQILAGEEPDVAIASAWDAYVKDIRQRGITDVEVTDLFLREQEFMLQGLVHAWVHVRLPKLLDEFEPVLIERELIWKLGSFRGVDVQDMIRCDALMRRKSDGMLFYVEFKTTTSGDDNWIQSWESNAQILINTVAVEETLGERLGGVLIEGLVKGKRRKCSLKTSPFFETTIQDSPLCYLFKGVDNLGGTHFTTGWTRGYTHVRTMDLFPNAKAVVTALAAIDPEVLHNLFVPVPPIRPRAELLERHRRQMLYQEEHVKVGLDMLREHSESYDTVQFVLDSFFPQNDDHCRRYYGSPCAMLEVCNNPAVGGDPLSSGLYVARVPHHAKELEQSA